MPYKLTVEGMDEITAMLSEAEEAAPGIAALALYDGAGVVADAITREAQGIRTAPFKYAPEGSMRDPSPEEKEILLNNGAAGIAKFDNDGNYVGTSVGYSRNGYAMVDFSHMNSRKATNYKIKNMKAVWAYKTHLTKRGGHAEYDRTKDRGLTNAKPVAVIANAINSGTSFMKKQPFIRNAISKSKKQAEEAIEARIRQLVEEMIHSA